jgi:hypothetical protein
MLSVLSIDSKDIMATSSVSLFSDRVGLEKPDLKSPSDRLSNAERQNRKLIGKENGKLEGGESGKNLPDEARLSSHKIPVLATKPADMGAVSGQSDHPTRSHYPRWQNKTYTERDLMRLGGKRFVPFAMDCESHKNMILVFCLLL